MPIQRVRPIKIESIAEGGGQADEYPTEVNIGEDYLDALGLSLQQLGANVSTSDDKVNISRATDSSVQFQDVPNGTIKLGQLLVAALGKPGTHAGVLDFSHWVGAPAEGFASGSIRQSTFTGALPQTVIWYASASATTKLFQTVNSYQGMLISQRVHTLYSNNVAVRTLTETFNYAGSLFSPTVTRVWS